ncbi:MAG: ABC transporter permease [Haloferacaceae archaeon]
MADPRLVVARRELRSLRAEKTIVLALLIQLFIAAFSSFLVVGLVSLYDPGSVEGYGTEVAVAGDEAAVDDLVAAAGTVEGLDARAYGGVEPARNAFATGRVDAVLVAETRSDRVFVTALVPDGDVRTTVIVVQLRDALRAFERAERAERGAFLRRTPLPLPPRAGASPYFGFTYTVLLPLLLFLPVFLGGSIAVDSVTEEVERGTLELLRVAPVTPAGIVDGKALAAAGLAPIQALAWVALLELNGTHVANLPLLVVLVAALAVVVVALGAGLGLVAAERRVAQLAYSLGTLVLFGGTTLLPGGPVNLAARLAIDSAPPGATAVVAAYAVGAVVGYAGLRALVERVGLG